MKTETQTHRYYYTFKLNGVEEIDTVIACSSSQSREKLRKRHRGAVTDISFPLTEAEYRAKLEEKIVEEIQKENQLQHG